ncbi:hypothetical protein, partial [Hyphomonas sp.]|uniref:hypothetical protein n=1 Tax=Hyphomonas sp. TaxID=87 RepID=UPI00391B3394
MTSTVLSSDNDLYAAYAAGSLDPAYALLVETQGAIRADVGAVLAKSEMVAASLMETAAGVEMSDRALDRALAAIDELEASTS